MVLNATSDLFQSSDYCGLTFAQRKEYFLHQLRSTGKLPYKRYTESPLRYAGGKSLAVGLVIERLPDQVDRVASPFMGGGSVEVAIAKELEIPVYA